MSLQPTNLHLVNGADVLDIKAFNSDAGAGTIQSSAPFAVIGDQSMAFVANGGVLQLGSNVGVRVINNGVQNYDLPVTTPSTGQIMVAGSAPAGSAVPLSFQTVNIPSPPPAGSSYQYNPSNANFDMGGYAISNASNVSSANYNLEDVGVQVDTNTSDISTLQGDVSTLQGQVSTLQSDVSTLQGQVASLITIIFNLTGIQV